MTDEQICEMLNRHRFLIIDEMTAWSHKINKNYPAEKLQKKVNKENLSLLNLVERGLND